MQLIWSKVFFCGTEGTEGTEVPGAEARLPGSLALAQKSGPDGDQAAGCPPRVGATRLWSRAGGGALRERTLSLVPGKRSGPGYH